MVTKAQQLLERILKENKYSTTTPRREVFRVLYGSEPLFMRELLALLPKTVDRVSAYRTIALFEQLGLVHRIIIGWKYKLELSEVFLPHHHHICCLHCGKITAIKEEVALEKSIQALASKAGFMLKSHQLELQGYCQDCQKSGYKKEEI